MDDLAKATVGDLMSADVLTVRSDASIDRARDLMLSLGLHALPVLEGIETIGIITSTDLVDEWPKQETVSKAMSWNPLAINPSASLSEAAGEMIDNNVHHLIVEDHGRLIGVLSSMDLLAAVRDRG